jgi:hypothetical protein
VAANLERRFIATDATFRAVHTTRSRLTVTRSPFTLERDAASPFTLDSRKGRLTQQDRILQLDTSLDVDYWEADPAWDGNTFKSAAQAVRPVRSDEVPRELKIKTGGSSPEGNRICVRLVTVQGKQFQLDV